VAVGRAATPLFPPSVDATDKIKAGDIAGGLGDENRTAIMLAGFLRVTVR
jgi:hypothetical protein